MYYDETIKLRVMRFECLLCMMATKISASVTHSSIMFHFQHIPQCLFLLNIKKISLNFKVSSSCRDLKKEHFTSASGTCLRPLQCDEDFRSFGWFRLF